MEVEICVLGGGPAGSVTAQRLARLGHDVLLVDRGGNAKPHRTESLAPAVPPILNSLCLQESLHRASFCCESHALLRWESDTVQIDRRHRGPSHLIDREQFDKCLREAASSAGVRLITPARAHAPRRHAAGGWDIRLSAPDGSRSIRARFLVDARGRRHGNETDGTQPPHLRPWPWQDSGPVMGTTSQRPNRGRTGRMVLGMPATRRGLCCDCIPQFNAPRRAGKGGAVAPL